MSLVEVAQEWDDSSVLSKPWAIHMEEPPSHVSGKGAIGAVAAPFLHDGEVATNTVLRTDPTSDPMQPRYLAVLLDYPHHEEDIEVVPPEIADRIDYLSRLTPNWDGYDSEAISPSAIKKCREIVSSMDLASEQTPFIAPMCDGGIQLDWEFDCGRELMVVIPSEGRPVRFLLSSPSEIEERSGILSDELTIQELFVQIHLGLGKP